MRDPDFVCTLAAIVFLLSALPPAAAQETKPPSEPSDRAAAPSGDEVWVLLLAGQSNMVGHGKFGELDKKDFAASPDGVALFEGGAAKPLGTSGSAQTKDGHDFGPEIGFGHEMARAFPGRKMIFVKVAAGGSSLAGGWDPDKKGGLYGKLLNAFKAATKDQPRFRVAGILWAQGGGDAKDEAAAKAYSANFQEFIERLRADIKAPEAPFLFTGARPEDPASKGMNAQFPFLARIRAAYVEAEKNVARARLVSTVGLGTEKDGIHYDTAGQIELGRRFARAYLDMTAPPAKSQPDGSSSRADRLES